MNADRRSVLTTALLSLPFVGAAAMALASGGYYLASWGAAALLLVLVAATLASAGWLRLGATPKLSRIAVAAFALYTGWTALSAVWADTPHAAWEEADRCLLYLAALLGGVALGGDDRARRGALAAWTLAVATVAAWMVGRLAVDEPAAWFLQGRLLGEVGYHNAQAALLLIPFWVALAGAAEQRGHWAFRGVSVAAAALLAQTAVLPESRGAALAFAVGGAVYFAVVPMRLRSLPWLVLALAPTAIGWRRLNGAYDALTGSTGAGGAAFGDALDRAALFVAASTVACGAVGVVLALVDRRVGVPRAATRVLGAGALLALVASLAVGASVYLDRHGNPVSDVREQWRNADAPRDEHAPDGSRFGTFASASNEARIVLWKVALRDVRHHPVLGVGADNFDATFYRHRTTVIDRYVRQPHNLTLESLSERGIVGGALLLGFVALVAVQIVRTGRRSWQRGDAGGAVTLAFGASLATWFAHSQLDWLWQMPAVTLPLFAGAGMALAVEPAGASTPRPRVVWRGAIWVAALAAVVSIGLPWLADRYVQRSAALAERDPSRAREYAERALDLTPASPAALRNAALRNEQTGHRDRALSLADRLTRSARSHYASWMFAAQLHHRLGDARARDLLATARAHNPLDPDLTLDTAAPPPDSPTPSPRSNTPTAHSPNSGNKR